MIGLLKIGFVIAVLIWYPKSWFPFNKHGFSNGCVFSEDVLRAYRQRVNKTDGVSEEEAGIVAQHEMVRRDVKNFFLNIFNKIKTKDSDTWLVTFQAYHDGPESGQALDVCIDKKSGDITCWEKRPLVIKEGKINNSGLFVTQTIEAE